MPRHRASQWPRRAAAALLTLAIALALGAAAAAAAAAAPGGPPAGRLPPAPRVRPRPAEAAPPPGWFPQPVAFQGSALLITWYSGVVSDLLARGVVVPGYTAVATALGMNATEQRDVWKTTVARCGAMFGAECAGHLNSPRRVNAKGRVRVALSQLDGSKPSLENSASWVIDKWSSKGDLIACLRSTDFLPCFIGLTTYDVFRNSPVIDGGYANGFEQLCPGGDTARCLKVDPAGDVASWAVGR
ncbi:MAG: hypothetical protein J3K34DRAFT_503879 [Monoraphidium minutum]|nr:MAG: hypothetical protein J3K34DRAFT_503879 [Monoraphidium minutum]